jgi:hypothetical protein
MLIDALIKSLEVSKSVASLAVIAEALDEILSKIWVPRI